MNLNNKLQRLAEILGHDADEIQLYLEQYPRLSAMSQLQLLSVAIRHELDPLCDEISVMDTPDGALPFITIDGWMKLINRHEQFAGMSLREPSEPSENISPWVECTIYRHDRILPIVVREYLDEVKTEHGSWTQMPRRMLRHRAIQQCARLAFGIACVDSRTNENPNELKHHIEKSGCNKSHNRGGWVLSDRIVSHNETKASRVEVLKQKLGTLPVG